ncbi:molybdopterin cofactor-binding domain-containing protein [Undibacterium sp. TS12]|uniref:xanthine dehydrogenase family protein molybdopterin-binding subunit n=1 Tax=Undibacterium sp. TS12 TaxID=2908202 RepID=UPI001F4C7A79|nr:molybdopterin cofactor-binding domain-containing protein [Undibacterium sp. TS12]MCH8621059.1 molybdopterin-dependent oxidoreductase [Undibacterium sp. TS12]
MKPDVQLSNRTNLPDPSRRHAIKLLASAAGSLALGFRLPALATDTPPSTLSETALGSWIKITPDNQVTVMVSQAEIGQGISTTLPAILVDELGADWNRVKLETSDFAPAFRNPKLNWMFTGNSESTQSFYDLMRKTGATAREMLVTAAAQHWQVAAGECRTENSQVWHAASGRHISFGALAADAARLPVPASPRLKQEQQLTLLGRPLPRVDVPAKVDGSARFGIDMQVPGMLHAAVRICPYLGGSMKSYNEAALKSQAGILAVVPLQNGIAVVAATYWQARSALLAHPPEFDIGPNQGLDSARLAQQYGKALHEGPYAMAAGEGDASGMLAQSKKRLHAEYENPFAAHATMEPMNCTADVRADKCEIWAPTQGQEFAHVALKSIFQLKDEQVIIHRTSAIGGGFGRRLLPDFVIQAALVSKAAGKPVKLLWDREEDFAHDYYRPASMLAIDAAIDAQGYPAALAIKLVSPTILLPVFPPIAGMLKEKHIDPSAIEGLTEIPYEIAAKRVDFHLLETPIPTSVMRTTGYGPNLFALECFIDELAHTARIDPLTYRRHLLRDNPRALAVLDKVAVMSQWSKKPGKKNRARGLAFAYAFGSYIAQVLELEVRGNDIHLLHTWLAVDCGKVLDPGIATAGIEGGVVFGMAYANNAISFKQGRCEQHNFNDYELPYLAQTPQISVAFINSGAALGGVGEVSPITVPPALSNAVFAATGKRIRRLPLSHHGFRLA